MPRNPRHRKSLWEGRKVVQKRGSLQDVLKGTNEEVRPKASKVEDGPEEKCLTRCSQRHHEEVRPKVSKVEDGPEEKCLTRCSQRHQ